MDTLSLIMRAAAIDINWPLGAREQSSQNVDLQSLEWHGSVLTSELRVWRLDS